MDIGLGDEVDGGFTLVRELRSLSATLPIIFLTARDSEFDTVAGLRLGADDYLTKDASLPQLARPHRRALPPRRRAGHRVGGGGRRRARPAAYST